MSRSSRQLILLILSYSGLAIAWGWRLHANDHLPAKETTSALDASRTAIITRLAHAPKHLQQGAVLQLATLSDSALRALQAWQHAVPEQRLRQLTVQQGPVPAPSPLNTALLFIELTRTEAPLIDDSRLLVAAAGDRLDETHKIEVLELLAAQALATHELSLAVAIHERACEFPAATWQNVLNFAEAARLARRPAAALPIVNNWLDATSPRLDAAQREVALDLQITLLLEGSRYAEASRVALDALRALPPKQSIPPTLMQRALLATRAAGESAELLPWIERQLRTYTDHQRTLQDLASGTATAPEYRQWLNEGGCIADLNQQTSIASELFFRLAATGDTRVLARLHALATQMGRRSELAQLLAGLQTRLSTVQVAQALADGDAPAAARALLAPHLQSCPADREGWRLLTQIDLTLRGEPAAVALWESFLKRFPDDAPALKHLAQWQLIVASSNQTAASDGFTLANMNLPHSATRSTATGARDETPSNLPAGTAFFQTLTATPDTDKVTHISMAMETR